MSTPEPPLQIDSPLQPLVHSVLQRVATGPELSRDISYEEAQRFMAAALNGDVHPVQVAVFLIALRMKRETDDELRGILQAIRDVTIRSISHVDEVLDISDPYDGFNRNLLISPFLPAVMAACGVATVSHGVKSVAPKFGVTHAGVLAAAGLNVEESASDVANRLANADLGWGYLDQAVFCPKLHRLSELRTLIVKRPALTTVEGFAAPVTGLQRTHLVTGYVHRPYPRIYAMLSKHSGFDSALMVKGVEGGIVPSLRESSTCWRAPPLPGVALKGSTEEESDQLALQEQTLAPQSVGIDRKTRGVPLPEGLSGYRRAEEQKGRTVDIPSMAAASAEAGLDALNGREGPALDSLVFTASLLLVNLGRADTLRSASLSAREAILSGGALSRFR